MMKNWGAVARQDSEQEDGVQSTASVASQHEQKSQSQSVSTPISDVTAERYKYEFEALTTAVVNTANGVKANAAKLQLAGLTSSVGEGAVSMNHLVTEVTEALKQNPNESTQRIAIEATEQFQQGEVSGNSTVQNREHKQYQNSPQMPFQKPAVAFDEAPAPSTPRMAGG